MVVANGLHAIDARRSSHLEKYSCGDCGGVLHVEEADVLAGELTTVLEETRDERIDAERLATRMR
ncbi:hypothetical protein [Haladaptatus sp. DFWS20]|uniref:hypothetical protein n=1 Tax=Haladaptatus sp. DFWS20 TaxID=3403467 RepID=UPI003EBE8FAA